MGYIIREDSIGKDRKFGEDEVGRWNEEEREGGVGGSWGDLGLKYKVKNGEEMFDIEIWKMSKSDMIKCCRDEWIVIPTETMRRLRGKEKKE